MNECPRAPDGTRHGTAKGFHEANNFHNASPERLLWQAGLEPAVRSGKSNQCLCWSTDADPTIWGATWTPWRGAAGGGGRRTIIAHGGCKVSDWALSRLDRRIVEAGWAG